jgi:hypothetical protein
MKKMTTAKDLILDRENFPKRTLFALPRAGIDRDLFAQYADKAEQQYVFENGMRVINLPEVRVLGERKQLRKSMYYDPSDIGVNIITEEEIRTFAGTNLAPVLNRIPGVNATGNGPSLSVKIRNNISSPLLVVDDMIQGAGGISIGDIEMSFIEQIDIFKGANPFGMRGFGGAIVIHTKRGGITTDNTQYLHIKHISPLGYQQPVEFYAPKYDTPEKRNATVPDLRTTIHWQPVVQTDEQGEASFEFYTADELTSYTVIIEGLADDGSIIRDESKLWIKDK